jgi:hypothetical protein
MKIFQFVLPSLALLFSTGFVSGASGVQNAVIALGPWEGDQPELLGVLSGGHWLSQQPAAKMLKGGENFKLYSNAGMAGSAKGSKPESMGVPCEENSNVKLKPIRKPKNFEIGVTGAWNPRPRAITILPNNSAPYLKIASEFLASKGLENPNVQLTSVLKVDLDNDKTDEVFLVGRAFHQSGAGDLFPPVELKAGDYSFLLMRKIVNGKVVTISLGDDVILKDNSPESDIQHLASLYDIAGILDLNGDGKLELVTYGAYYEGYNFEILEWTGKKFVSRAVSGCGA